MQRTFLTGLLHDPKRPGAIFRGMKWRNKKYLAALVLLAISACTTMMLAACTPTTPTAKADGITTNAPLVSQNNSSAGIPNAAVTVGADLKHSPIASADLTWNAANQQLQVTIKATGLAPNSTHPVHVHVGTCANNAQGQMLYTLTPLKADNHGNGKSDTNIKGVQTGIPASGWYVNIHNGPTLNTELEARPIACGDIKTTQAAAQANQKVHLDLVATTAPDENVQGTASFGVTKNNAIVLTLTVHGLIPHTMHMAHIHVGSCEAQGPVLYMLQTVAADANGNAKTQTTIDPNKFTNLPASQLYINIHEAEDTNGMKIQQGFNPIACGNIELRKA